MSLSSRKSNYLKILVLFAFTLVMFALYQIYNFYRYKKVFDKQAVEVSDYINVFSDLRKKNVPNNSSDFDSMLTYLDKFEWLVGLLDYGVGYKYDPKTYNLTIYSFGPDRVDDKAEVLIPANGSDKSLVYRSNIKIASDGINNWLWYYGKDVELFSIIIDEDYLCRNYDDPELLNDNGLIEPYLGSILFLNEMKSVDPSIIDRTMSKVVNLQEIEDFDKYTSLSFVRYENNFFSAVCSKELDTTIFNQNLSDYLIEQGIDYAIIPVLE